MPFQFPERREAEGPPTPARLYAIMRWWLVEHPVVASFERNPLRTWGAPSFFPTSAVLAYLAFTLLLRPLLLHGRSTPLCCRFVRLISPLHNAFLLLLSLAMAIGCSLATAAQMPFPSWLFCFPPPPTALLPADPRLSFLHVYHHAIVVVMCYLWLTARQLLLLVALVTNASVVRPLAGMALPSRGYHQQLPPSVFWSHGDADHVPGGCPLLPDGLHHHAAQLRQVGRLLLQRARAPTTGGVLHLAMSASRRGEDGHVAAAGFFRCLQHGLLDVAGGDAIVLDH
ncbi:hypothetical protein Taro_039780 [Colocasia esculenta]|uniref:Very-long-chain 3-oxoacyl-CoA synthase n=1 Tax=Colocasia esculenta TaxID=4460 RepID=A0A843WWN9_COLES|nr:hypothetical protein [Colocasia esculenta]